MASGALATPALSDALVILGAAGLVIPVFARARITPVIGFILVGVLVGPFGLGKLVFDQPWLYYVTISDPSALAPFAELGIVLLLFTIGLELSFGRLWQLRRLVFGLGALELLIIAGLLALLLSMMGQYWTGAIALGLALAMSSTALVLPIAGTTGPVGRAALSMLLFEDIMIVPIIFLLGALGPAAAEGVDSLLTTLWQGALVVGALLLVGRLLLPRLFAQAARTKSPELFLAATLLVVLGASLATAAVGLSPIVGALIAGLLIAETDFHEEIESIIGPFKGLALGVFLITVGMSIDVGTIWRHAVPILIALAGVLALKAVVTGVLLRLMGARRGTAAETGVLMASPSETTLIVLTAAAGASLIQPGTAQFWQIVTAMGMTVTPLLAQAGKTLSRRVEPGAASAPDPVNTAPPVVVVGAGRVGQLIGQMLSRHGKPYVAVDVDADLVASARQAGVNAQFGDASRFDVMQRLGIDAAPAVILTMDHPVLAQRLTVRLRKAFPALPIITRARDIEHAALLYRSGATHAIPDTLESSLQLSEAVLVDLGVPVGPVIASIHEKRDEFRSRIESEGALAYRPKLRTGRMAAD